MKHTHRLNSRRRPFRRHAVIVVGLGPIGQEVARVVTEHDSVFRLTAVIDRAPELIGRRLDDVLPEIGKRLRILGTAPPAPGGVGIAFLTTSSSLSAIAPTAEQLLKHGYHVVSSTEELSYPWLRHPRVAARLDGIARQAKRCLVGTGINPGWAMDVWPLALAANMQSVQSVTVHRVVDARQRRKPLQGKVGAEMTRAHFEQLARQGRIGHVGLVESVAHVADGMGWHLTEVRETLVPRLAKKRIKTRHYDVPVGRVCGIHHRAVGLENRTRRIELDLVMSLDASPSSDSVQLQGTPDVKAVVPGGFHGDRATVSQLLSAATRMQDPPVGLRLASELAVPGAIARPIRQQFEKPLTTRGGKRGQTS